MAVPVTMQDLSTLAASNSPSGSEAIGNSLDNYLRAQAAILRSTNAVASLSIAAASTTDVGAADGESVAITGAATISSFGTGYAGCRRELRFSGICTIAHSAAINVPTGLSYVTAAADVVVVRCVGAGAWVVVSVSRPNSTQVVAALGFTPVNKAGDTMTGALAAPSIGPSAASEGFQYLWNAINIGNGGNEYVNNRGGGGGGHFWYARATSADAAALAMSLTTAGDLAAAGSLTATTSVNGASAAISGAVTAASLTVGGGQALTKITLGTAAPGVLASGELYLKY